jgi:alpha-glucosidase
MLMSIFASSRNARWPEGAIVYQVYPRSFYDSNADGIGDIPGVTAKLNYLKELSVTAIWLSPFYPSPMADFGYDVADYCDVDPIFGTLKDMDVLIKTAHKKNIKIMVDLVPNHTSDEHKWFQQSRQSREDTYSDWYIWKDPKGHDKKGKPIPPNNWLNIFTGTTAWEWEPMRQQFYLHSFDVHQPDLNWANPEVREAIKNAMRFWLDRGVDGFRVDAVRFMGKDPMFKDNPKNPDYKHHGGTNMYGSIKHVNSQGWPTLYAYLNEMAAVLKEKPYRRSLRFMVTESYPDTHEPIEEYLQFYQGMDPEVAAPFNFEGLWLPWRVEPWHKFVSSFHKALEDFDAQSIASYAFGNHDQDRLVTRRGIPAARSAAVLLLTLPGMSFVYNGEEIGMHNGKIPRDMVQDPAAAGGAGRDPERTPLQWTPGKNAGFSEAHSTWLPIAEGYETLNVESERKDSGSFFTLYKRLGKLRRTASSIRRGKLDVIKTGHTHVLGYTRTHDSKQHLILVNFSDEPAGLTLASDLRLGAMEISSIAGAKHKADRAGRVNLAANEAVVFKLH